MTPWMHPKPTTFAIVAGELVTPDAIEFAVDDADGVEVTAFAAAEAVTGAHGMFAAAAYANTGAAGRRVIRWRMRTSPTAAWITWSTPWDTYRRPTPIPVYALVSDLRDEAITEAMLPTTRAYTSLMLASAEVSRFTGRTFGARAQVLMVDGRRYPLLQLEEPIIAVDEVVLDAESAESTESPVERDAFRVYNRHMTGMLSPDDRENPKLEFRTYGTRFYEPRIYGERSRFVTGQQNTRIRGVFGYTEPDDTPAGSVPLLITRATMLLAARLSGKIGDPGSSVVDPNAWKTVEEKTRDQAVRFADLGSTAAVKSGTSLRGAFTGDPEIDTILAMYVRGPRFGAV